jgi:hypothetical protein
MPFESHDHHFTADQIPEAATFLDEAAPGWADMINVERLDLWDCDFCILGQLATKHPNLTSASWPGDTPWERGKNALSVTGSAFAWGGGYQAWVREIEARRGAGTITVEV